MAVFNCDRCGDAGPYRLNDKNLCYDCYYDEKNDASLGVTE
jgi:NMD protein affecting ribosome stability and mRNA decay